MDQLTVDGIHVEIDGAGPPVVLTHDALTHSEAWDAQVAAWSADHLPHLEVPEAFNRLVHEFLTKG